MAPTSKCMPERTETYFSHPLPTSSSQSPFRPINSRLSPWSQTISGSHQRNWALAWKTSLWKIRGTKSLKKDKNSNYVFHLWQTVARNSKNWSTCPSAQSKVQMRVTWLSRRLISFWTCLPSPLQFSMRTRLSTRSLWRISLKKLDTKSEWSTRWMSSPRCLKTWWQTWQFKTSKSQIIGRNMPKN